MIKSRVFWSSVSILALKIESLVDSLDRVE